MAVRAYACLWGFTLRLLLEGDKERFACFKGARMNAWLGFTSKAIQYKDKQPNKLQLCVLTWQTKWSLNSLPKRNTQE